MTARSYAGSLGARSAARLDAGAQAGDFRVMEAIYVIALFLIVILALNRFEFGRFD